MATFATRFVSPRQRAWIEATQRRVNYSTNILGSLRNIKMLGLTTQMTTNIQSMRDLEMKKFRKSEGISTWGVAICKF